MFELFSVAVPPCHNVAATLQTRMLNDGEFNFLLYMTKPERDAQLLGCVAVPHCSNTYWIMAAKNVY